MTDRELLETLVDEFKEMKFEFQGVKSELIEVKSELTEVKSDVKFIKTQQSEHGEMIRSLIHASETQKAQHDALQKLLNLSFLPKRSNGCME